MATKVGGRDVSMHKMDFSAEKNIASRKEVSGIKGAFLYILSLTACEDTTREKVEEKCAKK